MTSSQKQRGSGCLYIVELDEIVVMETIAKDLLPWLQGEDDPIVKMF